MKYHNRLDDIEQRCVDERIELIRSQKLRTCALADRGGKAIIIKHNDVDRAEQAGERYVEAGLIMHEYTHLADPEKFMCKPGDGTQTIKDREDATIRKVIRDFVDPDELLDIYVESLGNFEEVADRLELPYSLIEKAFQLFTEISENFRKRCTEIHERYLWAQD